MTGFERMKSNQSDNTDLLLYTDGASRGNPGLAGAGIVVTSANGEILLEKSVFLGKATNNSAEYQALVIGLKELAAFQVKRLTINMDSELIVRQLNGQYRVRNRDLLPLYLEADKLIGQFQAEVKIFHIPREQNREADKMANLAIDDREK